MKYHNFLGGFPNWGSYCGRPWQNCAIKLFEILHILWYDKYITNLREIFDIARLEKKLDSQIRFSYTCVWFCWKFCLIVFNFFFNLGLAQISLRFFRFIKVLSCPKKWKTLTAQFSRARPLCDAWFWLSPPPPHPGFVLVRWCIPLGLT